MQALKGWHSSHPHLFVKSPRNHAGRDTYAQLGRGVEWIIWQSLSAVALRVIIIWLFEAAGQRVLIAVVFHAMINLSWAIFPTQGSGYDPFIAFLILAPIAIIAAIVGIPRTSCRAVANSSGPKAGDLQ